MFSVGRPGCKTQMQLSMYTRRRRVDYRDGEERKSWNLFKYTSRMRPSRHENMNNRRKSLCVEQLMIMNNKEKETISMKKNHALIKRGLITTESLCRIYSNTATVVSGQ